MGEETSVLNWHPKTALGHLRADKQLLTVFLHTEEDDSRFLDLSHQIKCFFFLERELKKALLDTFTGTEWYGLLSTTAN